jgi:hypothetical protein
MELREELSRSILTKLSEKKDPLEGFYALDETKEAILAVAISGRHLLLDTCRSLTTNVRCLRLQV